MYNLTFTTPPRTPANAEHVSDKDFPMSNRAISRINSGVPDAPPR